MNDDPMSNDWLDMEPQEMTERDGRYTMPTDGLVDLMERIAELEAENQRLSYRVDTWRRVARGALRNHYTLYKGIEKLRDEAENEARDETSRVILHGTHNIAEELV